MTIEPVALDDLLETRMRLVADVRSRLDDKAKRFLPHSSRDSRILT